MTDWIWITTQFEGFHSYLKAPKEVAFLRNKHRHIFHIKVYLEIFHNDRDIEFIMFKRFVDKLIKNHHCLNNRSCEDIADILSEDILYKYPNRGLAIEVSEDLENGCLKEYYR